MVLAVRTCLPMEDCPLGVDNLLEEEMATYSSTLAWRIPWTKEPTVHRVTKSHTRLKRLNTSISKLGFSYLFFQGASFNFMAVVSIHSDFAAQKIVWHGSHFFLNLICFC